MRNGWVLAAILPHLAMLGCAHPSGPADIADLANLRQDPWAYLGPRADWPLVDPLRQQQLYEQFRRDWLAAWDVQAVRPPAQDIAKPAEALGAAPGFGENLLPHSPAFVRAMLDALGGPACDLPCLSVANTDLRRLPTHRPRFEAVGRAGEGFPFDSLQESALWAGTPVRVWQLTPDGQWGYVDSPCGRGWAAMRDLASVGAGTIRQCRQARLAALVRDDVTLRDQAGQALLTTHIGAVFPIAESGGGQIVVWFPARDADGHARLRKVPLGPADAAVMPLPATPRTLATLAGRMIGQPYGWGGMFENRDCSSTTRDLMVPLGIPLPRNSADQAEAYASVPLTQLSPARRERAILEQGAPFMTLVRFPGHVALYIGSRDGRALILHNTWGVRTRTGGVEGRRVIGRCVITTLSPGIELPDLDGARGDLRDSIQSMVIVGQAKASPAQPAARAGVP